MKKNIAMLLVVLALFLSACGDGEKIQRTYKITLEGGESVTVKYLLCSPEASGGKIIVTCNNGTEIVTTTDGFYTNTPTTVYTAIQFEQMK